MVGFKDSSANAVYFQSVMYAMKDRQDFAMLVGPEEITAECVLLGGHGGINGGANMFPELYVDLYHAAVARDMETVSRLQPLVMQISSSIYTVGQHGSSYLKGLKCALSLLGVCDDLLRLLSIASMFRNARRYARRWRHSLLSGIETLNARSVCISLI